LTTANLIAQMNRSTVMPLKYLCVDAISEFILHEGKQSKKGSKVSKMLETYPEEIRSLFERKELWRWALMMGSSDEDKQRRALKLYQATTTAKKVNPDHRHYSLKIGNVEFSTILGTNWYIWPGTGDRPENAYELYYQEFSEYIGSSGHVDVWSKEHEKNNETLELVMKECGWPVEDRYVFLRIIETVAEKFDSQESLTLSENLFSILLNRFMQPPQWYSEFVLITYGIANPPVPRLE
jgi:hypothetical protein